MSFKDINLNIKENKYGFLTMYYSLILFRTLIILLMLIVEPGDLDIYGYIVVSIIMNTILVLPLYLVFKIMVRLCFPTQLRNNLKLIGLSCLLLNLIMMPSNDIYQSFIPRFGYLHYIYLIFIFVLVYSCVLLILGAFYYISRRKNT